MVFEDTGRLDEQTVHLHLEQRVVQRLLARFRAQGFIYHDLSRACLAQSRDSIPRVVLLGRLSLYGRGAERLHEEIVPVAARWTDPARRSGALQAYARDAQERTMRLLDESLNSRARTPDTAVQRRLLAGAGQDIADLRPQLEPRAREFAAIAERQLARRGQQEEKELRKTLERHRNQVVDQLVRYERDHEQLSFGFNVAETRQLNADIRHWRRRLERFDEDLAHEPVSGSRVLRGAGKAGRAGGPHLPVAGDQLMAKPNRLVTDHLEWIGFVRPTGLVVSATALVKAGVILNRRDITGQKLLRECVENGDREPVLPDFPAFARTVLGWSFSPKGYAGTDEAPIPSDLELPLPESGRVFRPDFAVRAEPARTQTPASFGASDDDGDAPSPWQLLVSIREPGEDLDRATSEGGGLDISPHGRMERLLRHTGVPAGLIINGKTIRLVSAPRGESSGWLDFRVSDMVQTAGRPICSAMRELLGQTRLLSVPRDKRLAALLEDSRKFQNEVSERLAEQVLHALYELLRGFQAAHDASNGQLLNRWLADDPDEIYRGLLTVVLRLVYLLYAEERDLLPQDETFLGSYSVSGLYERLRADASVHPDTMDQRFGAYAQLLALWRMVHDGAHAPQMAMAPKHGDLFHPDRYPFLEGAAGIRQTLERIEPPRVGDGTIHRVLEKLIVLDGERISYRALDVEHIGSVYETMMGFRLERATGRSIAIKAAKKHGAPSTVDIEALLSVPPAGRAKWIRDRTDRKLSTKVGRAARECDTLEELHATLDTVIDRNATPDLVPAEAMVLQPSEERRRSGSHYTPRELTEPIVRVALEPILARLSDEADGPVHPEQILGLKVCDPAMGSGAFLVEACRQLSEALIGAWRAHDATPDIPPDENEEIFARRLVAQRCLYGVDRNPKAVDLAKLSLWLITLSKDHPLTFLDHALRHGDSLVGLSIPQLRAFHWKGNAPHFRPGFEALRGQEHLDKAAELRSRIREATDNVSDWERRDWLRESEEEDRRRTPPRRPGPGCLLRRVQTKGSRSPTEALCGPCARWRSRATQEMAGRSA